MMLFTVEDFLEKARRQRLMDEILADWERMGRTCTPSEVTSWRESLPALADALALRRKELQNHWIALEVSMPGANFRADAVLLGTTALGESAVLVVELKRWPAAFGGYKGLARWGRAEVPLRDYHLHPSMQAAGYARYLLAFSSALVDEKPSARAFGCAFLHSMKNTTTLAEGIDDAAEAFNKKLMTEWPAFGRDESDAMARFATVQLPSPPSRDFVERFRNQERSGGAYLQGMLEQMRETDGFPWVLADEQAEVMAKISRVLSEVAEDKRPEQRRVVIVCGPPGCGKTILAAQALIEGAAVNGLVKCAFVTSTKAQRDSIEGDMEQVLRDRLQHAGEVSDRPVMGAGTGDLKFKMPGPTSFHDRKTGSELMSMDEWKHFLDCWPIRLLTAASSDWEKRDRKLPQFDLLVCDEAQGLVDPARPRVSGSQANAWKNPWGPQAAHLMLKSRLTIFFMDQNQGYRQVESTWPADVEEWAKKLNDAASGTTGSLGNVKIETLTFDLDNLQFRLAGGLEFLRWLDQLLKLPSVKATGRDDSEHPIDKAVGENRSRMKDVFQVVDKNGASDMRDRLRKLERDGGGPCRLLAGFAWNWVTKKRKKKKGDAVEDGDGVVNPVAMTDTASPICSSNDKIDSIQGVESGRLSPRRTPIPGLCFNYPGLREQHDFNLGNRSFDIDRLFGADDSVPAHVGYPLTVRGRDFQHVGVIWGCDLVWRSGHWLADPVLVYGSDNPTLRKSVREYIDKHKLNLADPAVVGKLAQVADMRSLANALAAAYRILLTRGMRTVQVWIEDPETREYVRSQWELFLAGPSKRPQPTPITAVTLQQSDGGTYG